MKMPFFWKRSDDILIQTPPISWKSVSARMWHGDSVDHIEFAFPVVYDAGPLIHLHQLDSLDLLANLDQVVVREQACIEVERHRGDIFPTIGFPVIKRVVKVPITGSLAMIIQDFSLEVPFR